MGRIKAVISDFGGVLTTPLEAAVASVLAQNGVPLEALGRAMVSVTEHDGANPLFELEKGRVTEAHFLARLDAALAVELGTEVRMASLGEGLGSHLRPNPEMIDYLRTLKARGLRLAMLTNNVREWEARWRAMLPVDELFEVVVDSAFVGMRKPEPEIYALTLERLGLDGDQCVFVDDVEINCVAAREQGIVAVWFRDAAQARGEIEAALGG